MKKIRKASNIILLVTTALILGTSFRLYEAEDSVKLKLYYMAYACDCASQYRVIKVLASEYGKRKSKEIVGKDITVEFNDAMLAEIETRRLKCSICFYYDVKGGLREENGKHILKASHLIMYEKSRNCCEK